jgi:hypothetical protein
MRVEVMRVEVRIATGDKDDLSRKTYRAVEEIPMWEIMDFEGKTEDLFRLKVAILTDQLVQIIKEENHE